MNMHFSKHIADKIKDCLVLHKILENTKDNVDLIYTYDFCGSLLATT